jgi:acyl carrier protein
MTEARSKEAIFAALAAVKGVAPNLSTQLSLIKDLDFESIDVVDFFFEIEQTTGVVIELNQVMGQGGGGGRRFDSLTIQDLIDYLAHHN